MKNAVNIICPLLIFFFTTTATAQFGKKFSPPSFVPPTVNGSYYYGSGQLFALVETTPANEEAWLFVDNKTGALRGSLRLDSNHGAMTSPDGGEILVAGARLVNNQPVYFAGRYNATNLQPIAERQIDVVANDGYTLSVSGREDTRSRALTSKRVAK